MELVFTGISEKVALTLASFATFITGLVIGFVKNWRLSFVLLSIVFAVIFVMGGFSVFIVRYSKRSIDAYAPGTSLAEEVLTSVRTLAAFNGQEKLASKFEESLINTSHWAFRLKATIGCMIASMMCILYLEYGLSFWEGSRLLVAGYASLAETLTVLLALLMGAVSVAHAAPHIQAFGGAVAAAGNIFKVIDRQLSEDVNSGSHFPEEIQGTLEFQGVKHIYPSRPEVTVLHDFDLVVPAGKVTALVGGSGSGKSTLVSLLERFYTPVGGKILLDGHDIQTLDLKMLRRQMSLVNQEPVLFNCSIRRNIEYGLIGTNLDTSQEEKNTELVIQAAKMANAHDFISRLPDGYETITGDRGILLSGGQKQRIAIARAIISNPKILLLDEATSALDSQSEGVVQEALDVAAQGRTTIIIAHRLSTIKDADNIVVMTQGRIVEQGTHDALLGSQGAYHALVEAQKIAQKGELSAEEEEAIDAQDDELEKDLLSRPKTNQSYREDPDDKNIANKLNRTATDKSQSSLALQGKNSIDGEHRDSTWTLIKLIASFNGGEWHIMLFGLCWSIICGAGNPVQAVFFAKEIINLSIPLTDPGAVHTIRHNVDFWSLMYLMLAFVQLIAYICQGWAFAYCSEKLIRRVRIQAFRTMLRQDIEFFDKEGNSAGALTSFLSTETTHVAGISGVTLGTILSVATTLVAAIILSVAVAWRLALVCVSTIPVLLACGFFRFWLLAQFQRRAKKAYEVSASYACEATSAIRTVASLTREEDVLQHYQATLDAQAQKSLKSVLQSSLLYAASQSFVFGCLALGFWSV